MKLKHANSIRDTFDYDNFRAIAYRFKVGPFLSFLSFFSEFGNLNLLQSYDSVIG